MKYNSSIDLDIKIKIMHFAFACDGATVREPDLFFIGRRMFLLLLFSLQTRIDFVFDGFFHTLQESRHRHEH